MRVLANRAQTTPSFAQLATFALTQPSGAMESKTVQTTSLIVQLQLLLQPFFQRPQKVIVEFILIFLIYNFILLEPVKKCQIIQCQTGYTRKEIKSSSKSRIYHAYLSPMISFNGRTPIKSYTKTVKTINSGTKGGVKKSNLQRPLKNLPVTEDQICKEYKCVSNKPPPKFIITKEECPPIMCQANYVPVYDDLQAAKRTKECPKYSCYPPVVPDSVCNVTGRTFNTFDNTEYKYDICNHVLARDLQNDEWDVSLKKNCTKHCSRDLIIRHHNHLFVLYPDLTVELDGYRYSVDQTKKIGSKSFAMTQLGNTLLFTSNRYGFWIIWNVLGNVKLGVINKLSEQIDGLCGFFNEIAEDDKRKPDGTPARTTVEFGDSWALASDQPVICEAKTCPLYVQNQAWEMCNKIKFVFTEISTVFNNSGFFLEINRYLLALVWWTLTRSSRVVWKQHALVWNLPKRITTLKRNVDVRRCNPSFWTV